MIKTSAPDLPFPIVEKPMVLLLYCSPDLEMVSQRKSLLIPTGLFFLAAHLHSCGIAVTVENFSTLSPEEWEARLLETRPDYVGMSMLTMNRFSTLELASLVRKTLPHTKIVLGGPHVSALATEMIESCPEIDCVVCGEGEATLAEVIERWEGGEDLDGVRGTVFRKGEEIIRNDMRPWIEDLSSLSHPAGLFAYEKISTSRGCPFQCAFCSSSQFWGRAIRSHSADWVVEEIELLYKKHGIREFSINDDLFTLDKERVISICDGIVNKRLYVRFHCMSRVNTLCEDRLSWLKRAGCYRIDFGVESGSERLLKAMGKKTDLGQVRRAFQMTREAGIGTGCFLIVGFPGEDDQSIAETKRLLKQIRPTFCDISSMAIFPDSPVYRNLLKEGAVTPDIWFEMHEHTLFLTEAGGKERYKFYLEGLRAAYEEDRESFAFTTSQRQNLFLRHRALGHAAMELAQALCTDGQYPKALKTLTEATEMEKANPFLWCKMAEISLLLGNPALAIDAVQVAFELQPRNYDTLLLAARISESSGDVDTALDLLEQGIGARPEKIEGYLHKGDLLAGHRKWAEAYESYASAVKIDPYWSPLKDTMRQCEAHL
jgi:anaerobic magnesium-protoporphyrin IX monomethyl ester cyclase